MPEAATRPGPGSLLVATPVLVDPNFARTVVMLISDDDGAVGVVLNRPSDLAIAETLPAFASIACAPQVVFFGGPVASDHAIALGSGAHHEQVMTDLGVVDLEADPDLLAPASIRIFAGYAGWAAGQLETEIAEGSWFVVEGFASDALDPDPPTLWRRVLARQPGRMRVFAGFPDDPSLN